MTADLDRLTAALADRYTLQRELGRGGMATVYLAEDLKHERMVALKVLKPELSAILGAERFLSEIKTTANLQHPNILPLYDSGEADTFLYYVMPWVEGETLRDRLNREKQLSVAEAVEIAKAVAGALSYAHSRGVIHRDIKPENILLESGQAVVADFGIALAVTTAGGQRLTESGLSLGTPQYMSPEQATGERNLDGRSDVYSLGCVVYEMLVGDPPHTGSTVQGVIAKVLSERPAPIGVLRDRVPANVEAATQQALAKIPADRFATAAQFAEALGNPAFALPATMRGPSVAATGPWKRASIAAAAVAVLAVAVALWALLRPARELPGAVSRYTIPLPAGQEHGAGVALSPDGSLVYRGRTQAGYALWIRSPDRLDAVPVPGTEGGISPAFSPDGRRIAFIIGNGLRTVATGGGAPVTVVDSGVVWEGVSWGTDGYLYAPGPTARGPTIIGNQPSVLVRVPQDGGALTPVTTLDTARGEIIHWKPRALPNGKGVLFSVIHRNFFDLASHEIAVVDLESGTHRILVRGVLCAYALSGHLVYVTADGTLMAVPFDQDRLEITGSATPLAEGVRIVGAGGVALALSTTGTLVYAPGSVVLDSGEVVRVARDGSHVRLEPSVTGFIREVVLSPDGRRLATKIHEAPQRQVWVAELPGGALSRLTSVAGEGLSNHSPRWTPDGQSVSFVSDSGPPGKTPGLYVKRADGSRAAELLVAGDSTLGDHAWSPRGGWLVFSKGHDLFALRPGVDSGAAPLMQTPFRESQVALSPAGRWLAYTSDQSGRVEVYVRPFPNVGDAVWQVSPDGGTEPRWAHSGRELFYRNAEREMIAVATSTEPTFALGDRRVLFPAEEFSQPAYDVTGDDLHFVMIRGFDTAPKELIVVLNFFEELKAKVGN